MEHDAIVLGGLGGVGGEMQRPHRTDAHVVPPQGSHVGDDRIARQGEERGNDPRRERRVVVDAPVHVAKHPDEALTSKRLRGQPGAKRLGAGERFMGKGGKDLIRGIHTSACRGLTKPTREIHKRLDPRTRFAALWPVARVLNGPQGCETGTRQSACAAPSSTCQTVSTSPFTPEAGASLTLALLDSERATASALPAPATRNHTARERFSAP